MIQMKIYNSDKVRHWYNFPSLKDPRVFEKTLAVIFSELLGIKTTTKFNLLYHDMGVKNLYFNYLTSSNFYAWGELPFSYIYNDMVRHIQNRNSGNNFVMTLESIEIDNNIFSYMPENPPPPRILLYNIISMYISENYLGSYTYMLNNNNGILVVYIPSQTGLKAYIVSVGFDPYEKADWMNSSCSISHIPYARYCSLKGISAAVVGRWSNIVFGRDLSLYSPNEVLVEMDDTRARQTTEGCKTIIRNLYSLPLGKSSELDTEIKYGNFALDYNTLDLYDQCVPFGYMTYNSKSGEENVYRFNYAPGDESRNMDFSIMKKQNMMIKINEKKKGVGM